ncbi:MAG: large subunit ribosomal protein L6 [Candidatus Electronema aureum]|uniref:Large ribosomal subunit protein uL6 n=1 Tax=Candidatus Electronema aureum TaxID=2005002 RepID=A0A521G4T8_9BACT|nr:MAG: large subunit ribosomal protein L6 [Candidatus Electronema aureum]
MSRIGKSPVELPGGIKVEIQGTRIKVTGKKGTLERTVRPEIEIEQQDNQLVFKPKGGGRQVSAYWGLTRTLVRNMVAGVDKGFEKVLAVEGVGYRAAVEGSKLTLNVGYSVPVEFMLPAGIAAAVDKANNITVSGIDKEQVGQIAATIRDIRKPEPYKGKGIRYSDEHIVRKAGKSGGKGKK